MQEFGHSQARELPASDGAAGAIASDPACASGVSQSGASRVPLTQLKPGQEATIHAETLPDSERDLLRAMGLHDHARVVLCRVGEPCIVRVMGGCGCSSRIGLARPLAEKMLVGPVHADRAGLGPEHR
jgi:Fe2+ transport system protein FeoA